MRQRSRPWWPSHELRDLHHFGAVVRSDDPASQREGWQALHKYGVRTVIGLRPVGAVDSWCQAADIRDGRLFRPINRRDHLSGHRVSAAAINRIDPTRRGSNGHRPRPLLHPLRAGFATAAAEAGVDERSIMAQAGHKSLTVARATSGGAVPR